MTLRQTNAPKEIELPVNSLVSSVVEGVKL
jgi:hypothetical protein